MSTSKSSDRRIGHLQCRSSLNAELTVEHKDRLLTRVATRRRRGFVRRHAQEELLDTLGCVDVDGAWNMAAVVLIVEPAVNDVIILQLRVIDTIQQAVELNGMGASAYNHPYALA